MFHVVDFQVSTFGHDWYTTLSAGTVEYTDCISAEGWKLLQTSVLDMTQKETMERLL